MKIFINSTCLLSVYVISIHFKKRSHSALRFDVCSMGLLMFRSDAQTIVPFLCIYKMLRAHLTF